ncbi:MAG: hypothetical protein GY953_37670 [bacterium]|nr:hypothetical protein [bacterium]
MGRISLLLRAAARQLAAHPEVREKATKIYEDEVKPRAKTFYEKDVKPTAQTAWREGKPKVEAAGRKIREVARENDPRKDPGKFASKLKERFFDRKPKR